ncbi:hypothetical protein [Cytobacillus pseudoceanisediminis]|uniref:hypothetical protein n=1 Tax=Cytobacillus pseudoceanisediminis TaxID=3051614 RepID=UPI003C2E9ED5
MRKECNHDQVKEIAFDPFLLELGLGDDAPIRYQCKDCFKKFTKEELELKNKRTLIKS